MGSEPTAFKTSVFQFVGVFASMRGCFPVCGGPGCASTLRVSDQLITEGQVAEHTLCPGLANGPGCASSLHVSDLLITEGHEAEHTSCPGLANGPGCGSCSSPVMHPYQDPDSEAEHLWPKKQAWHVSGRAPFRHPLAQCSLAPCMHPGCS